MYWWVYTRPSTYLYRLSTHRKCYDVEYQGFIPQGQNSRPFTDKNMGKDFTHCTVFLHKSDLYSIQLQLQPLSYLLNLFAYIMFEWSLTLSEKKSLTDDCLLTVDVEYLDIFFVAYIIQFSPTFRNFGHDILSA